MTASRAVAALANVLEQNGAPSGRLRISTPARLMLGGVHRMPAMTAGHDLRQHEMAIQITAVGRARTVDADHLERLP